jgi:hypothetical protein
MDYTIKSIKSPKGGYVRVYLNYLVVMLIFIHCMEKMSWKKT